jgi:hypothetical protein
MPCSDATPNTGAEVLVLVDPPGFPVARNEGESFIASGDALDMVADETGMDPDMDDSATRDDDSRHFLEQSAVVIDIGVH